MQAVSKTQVKATREEKIISDINKKDNSILNYLSQVKDFLLSDIKIVKAEYSTSEPHSDEPLTNISFKRSLDAKNAKLTANIKNQVLFR